jgi:hypothetical protein
MFSSIAIAASTASQGSTATTSSSSPSPTPFTKVANAVSNTFLIGATAAAGAALGRYFILTKEAEKEREILEKDVVPSLNSSATNTKSPEVVVVPTLSTKELSLTLSIASTGELQGKEPLRLLCYFVLFKKKILLCPVLLNYQGTKYSLSLSLSFQQMIEKTW